MTQGFLARLGRRCLDRAPGPAEALAALAALPAGAAGRLREYLNDDFLILYAVAEAERVVHLLSIRHHRELSFQSASIWQGP